MLVKQTKAQVRAYVREHGAWKGYVVGCNVNEYHIVGGWSLGFSVELFWHDERGVCVVGETTCEHAPTPDDPFRYAHFPRKLENLIADWTYYNACNETGYYPAFYRIAKR